MMPWLKWFVSYRVYIICQIVLLSLNNNAYLAKNFIVVVQLWLLPRVSAIRAVRGWVPVRRMAQHYRRWDKPRLVPNWNLFALIAGGHCFSDNRYFQVIFSKSNLKSIIEIAFYSSGTRQLLLHLRYVVL